ncbi:amino ABC transporter, permease, 3-TM region, His/Glu/Gln/Arg/opine family domain protein [Burkholderia pseudomallei MSHR456]|nr:amino ABC transporter, permease, 3-TM region, His/Glu/Gln/Arg/opine family domain protein [Burkholderia pseudomallei MSHR456]
MDLSILANNLPYLLVGAFPDGPLGGAALSLVLALASALASAGLGVALGVALALATGALRGALVVVIGFFRAIPVLMLIFWTYFLLPVLLHADVPGLAAVVCALSLVGGAYLAHSVHAGIRAAGDGQWQAGLALGLTRWQTVRHVLLPQAVRIMTPSFVNQWVSLVKDTSLAYIVGVPELSFRRDPGQQSADGVSRADLPVRRRDLPDFSAPRSTSRRRGCSRIGGGARRAATMRRARAPRSRRRAGRDRTIRVRDAARRHRAVTTPRNAC